VDEAEDVRTSSAISPRASAPGSGRGNVSFQVGPGLAWQIKGCCGAGSRGGERLNRPGAKSEAPRSPDHRLRPLQRSRPTQTRENQLRRGSAPLVAPEDGRAGHGAGGPFRFAGGICGGGGGEGRVLTNRHLPVFCSGPAPGAAEETGHAGPRETTAWAGTILLHMNPSAGRGLLLSSVGRQGRGGGLRGKKTTQKRPGTEPWVILHLPQHDPALETVAGSGGARGRRRGLVKMLPGAARNGLLTEEKTSTGRSPGLLLPANTRGK